VQQLPDNRAERVMKAFAEAYPDKVGTAEERDGDWCVRVYGITFFYCNGRLLPESLRLRENDYDPQPFYGYPAELPVWKAPSAEQTARMKSWSDQRDRRPPRRNQLFFDALWLVHNRKEAEDSLRKVTFLDREVAVHQMIVEPLARVNVRIQELSRSNTAVRNWVRGLRSISCWNWRNIAATESRSFHSYGAALDLQAPTQRGMESYWLWSSQKGLDWWAVPYSMRQHPPQEVIKAFEENGFCWGGKWPMYDTMHFEYRPEILIYNGILKKR
jgi:hypothetical protein